MNRILAVAALTLALLFGACASPYTPSPDRPFEPITEFTSKASLALVNAQTNAEEQSIGGRMLANYVEWTDVAIQIAHRELTNRGVQIDPKASRTLKMSIVKAEYDVGFIMIGTTIDMDVETGDGYKARFQGVNRSAIMANPSRQVDGAMMRVVVAMLKDPRIVAYLTE